MGAGCAVQFKRPDNNLRQYFTINGRALSRRGRCVVLISRCGRHSVSKRKNAHSLIHPTQICASSARDHQQLLQAASASNIHELCVKYPGTPQRLRGYLQIKSTTPATPSNAASSGIATALLHEGGGGQRISVIAQHDRLRMADCVQHLGSQGTTGVLHVRRRHAVVTFPAAKQACSDCSKAHCKRESKQQASRRCVVPQRTARRR